MADNMVDQLVSKINQKIDEQNDQSKTSKDITQIQNCSISTHDQDSSASPARKPSVSSKEQIRNNLKALDDSLVQTQ